MRNTRAAGLCLLLAAMVIVPISFRRRPRAARPPAAAHATRATPPALPKPPPVPQVKELWAHAREETDKSAEELAAQDARETRQRIAYSKLVHGAPSSREIALTFDDGPHPRVTPQLLEILDREHVKATFFVVGEMALKSPSLIRAERQAGHTLGNHTFHHYRLTKLPLGDVLAEWEATQDALRSITGETVRFCRPPGGDYDNRVIAAAQEVGLITVLWTDNGGDYASPGRRTITGRVFGRIGNGGVILLHDGVQQTVNVLPQLIQYLRSKGYRFVTIDEMWRDLPKRVEPRASRRKRPPVSSGRAPAASPGPGTPPAHRAPTRTAHTGGVPVPAPGRP